MRLVIRLKRTRSLSYCFAERKLLWKLSGLCSAIVFRHFDRLFNSPHHRAPGGASDYACGNCEIKYHLESRGHWDLATLEFGCDYIMRPRISASHLVHLEVDYISPHVFFILTCDDSYTTFTTSKYFCCFNVSHASFTHRMIIYSLYIVYMCEYSTVYICACG